jgi:hypothetical protein
MAKARFENVGKKDHLKRDMELADLRAVLNTKWGRRVFWRIVSRCGPLRQSFDHSAAVSAFNEGQRSIGLWMWAEMEQSCPEAYEVMRREAKEQIENQSKEDKKDAEEGVE